MSQELNLWIKKIFILIGFTILWYMLYELRSLILILTIAWFFTIIINPLVEAWEKRKVPAWITVLWVYIIILILWSIVIGTLIPIVINYLTDTATLIINWANTAQRIYSTEWIHWFQFHPYIEKVITLLFWSNNISHTLDIIKQNAGNIQSFLTNQITAITSNGISIVSSVGWVVAEWWLIAITSFLMVLERHRISRFILHITPEAISTYLYKHYIHIQHVCNAWIKATLILSGSIFIVTYTWLTLLKLLFDIDTEKTFTLALISGIMEFIPYIGPIIALIPALIIWLGLGWKAALIISILYIIIQRIENDFLVPYVMSKSLDLSPFLVFIVMIIGASLGWILGIILAVPIAWVGKILYTEYMKKHYPEATKESNPPSGKEKVHHIKERLIAFYKKIDKKS
jgi:predicted PurR-regulated permease PerM